MSSWKIIIFIVGYWFLSIFLVDAYVTETQNIINAELLNNVSIVSEQINESDAYLVQPTGKGISYVESFKIVIDQDLGVYGTALFVLLPNILLAILVIIIIRGIW